MYELFEVFGVNWKLLLMQAFNFGLLLVVLTYFLYKPVLRIIDERRENVAEGVRNAEEALQNLATSETEVKEIVTNASREAEARAEALLKDADVRAAEAQRQALVRSEKEIAQAAMLAAEKVLRGKSV